MQTISAEEFKNRYGNQGVAQFSAPQPTAISPKTDILGPAKDSLNSLKTNYGGTDQGIARKLGSDISGGADQYSQGVNQANTATTLGGKAKGIVSATGGLLKSAYRTAGDFAGNLFAPVGAAIGATGINPVINAVVDKGFNQKGGLIDTVSNNPTVQKFAMANPNAGEDFNRGLNLAFASTDRSNIEPSTALSRTKTQVNNAANAMTEPIKNTVNSMSAKVKNSSVGTKANDMMGTSKSVEQMRADRIKSGYEEQNTRLKSADRSFNKNTKSYKGEDGTVRKVTPIDTLMKHNVTPTIEKGSINMGDYKTGEGALGKIKEKVSSLDEQIDGHLSDDSSKIKLDDFKNKAIEQIKKDSALKQSGKVQSTIDKLGSVFDDYKNSYGETLSEKEINAIRKVMNQDYHPDTMDVSHVLGDTARKIVYDSTPNAEAKNLLREQGELLSAKKYAESIHGTKVTGGRLGTMAMRTGGAIIGSTLHNLPIIGPLAGMLGGEAMGRAMQQTQFKSPIAEGRALLQRSNSSEPTTSANTIPNKATMDSTVPQTPKKSNSIPNKQAGTIKNPYAPEVRAVDTATKSEMKTAIDYIRGKEPFNKNMEETIFKLQEKFGIPTNASSSKLADALQDLIEKTKNR